MPKLVIWLDITRLVVCGCIFQYGDNLLMASFQTHARNTEIHDLLITEAFSSYQTKPILQELKILDFPTWGPKSSVLLPASQAACPPSPLFSSFWPDLSSSEDAHKTPKTCFHAEENMCKSLVNKYRPCKKVHAKRTMQEEQKKFDWQIQRTDWPHSSLQQGTLAHIGQKGEGRVGYKSCTSAQRQPGVWM